LNKTQIKLCEKIYDKNKSSYKKVKMMAFLFKGKKLLNTGINSDKTDPVQSKYRKHIIDNDIFIDKRHAEVDCLKSFSNKSDSNLKDLTLWIISKRSDGTFRDSKPCKVCRQIIDKMKVGEICYYHKGRLVSEKLIKN